MSGIFQVAVEAIIEKDGKVLITQRAFTRNHAPGAWETLTGRLEQGESFEDALIREVKEEVGLEVTPVKPFYTFHFFRGPQKEEHVGVSYWCRYKSGTIKLEPKEQIAYKWATVDEALKIITDPSIKRALELFRDEVSRASLENQHK